MFAFDAVMEMPSISADPGMGTDIIEKIMLLSMI